MWESGSCSCHPSPSQVLRDVQLCLVQGRAAKGAHTHLADELAHALVEANIVVLELLDNSVCLGGEPHGEWFGYGRRGRESLRVFADGFGGGLGKRRVGRTKKRVKIYYMREMEQLGVMKNKLDELRQGAAGSANVLFHVCTYYTACVLYLMPGTYHDTRPTGEHGEIVRGSIGEGCGLGARDGGAKKEERCSSPGQGRIEAVKGPRPRVHM